MNESLSNTQMQQFLNDYLPGAKVILYPEIADIYKSGKISPTMLRWINGERPPLVILYLSSKKYGHWMALFENEHGINFFDSYGNAPDDQMKWPIDAEFRRLSGEDRAHLVRFILDIMKPDEEVYYDEHDYQSRNPKVTTCGRHVLFRLLNMDLSVEEYNDLIKMLKKFNKLKSADEVVVDQIRDA